MQTSRMERELRRLAWVYVGMMVMLFFGILLYAHVHYKNLKSIEDLLIIRISSYRELLDTLGMLFFVFMPIMIAMYGIGVRKLFCAARHIDMLHIRVPK
jgi:hypothetical protein